MQTSANRRVIGAQYRNLARRRSNSYLFGDVLWSANRRAREAFTMRRVDYLVRPARSSDVRGMRGLVDANVASGRLLDKATVTLYEDIQEFLVADRGSDGQVIGCGALHVMWEDLAEIRTIAVDETCRGEGVGYLLVEALLARARELGVCRVFVLTFAVKFFRRLCFEEISGEATTPQVYPKVLRS